MNFTISCIPPKATHQGSAMIMRRADGTQFVGKSKSSKGARVQRDLLSLFQPHAPARPMEGPLSLIVKWKYPWRLSESKKNRERDILPCDKRPDIDNLCKLLFDVMRRAGFFLDDAQIAHLTFRKEWTSQPGIEIDLGYSLENCNR